MTDPGGAWGPNQGWGPPPQQGWGPPPGYGQPPYYAPQTDGKAIGALVAAILSWVVCPVIPAVVALILASQSGEVIAASGGRLTGESFNTAARITAWINIGLYVGGGLLFLLFVFALGA